MVSPQFSRLDNNTNPTTVGPLSLRDAFYNHEQYFTSGGTDPILRGLMKDTSREVDEFMTRVLTTQLLAPAHSIVGQDLAALNIQRGRDHGIPSYTSFQHYCGNTLPKFHSQSIEHKLKELYGNVGIDLWIGGLAEKKIKESNLGPTFACIIGKTFADLRNGDRYYWENQNLFTNNQRNMLGKIRLSKIICDNADDISQIIPNALETNQPECNCSELPLFSLEDWKEECSS